MPAINPNAGLEGIGMLIRGQAQQNARQQYDDAAPDREIERRLRSKRLKQLSDQMIVEDEARRRDAADLMRADEAFNQFQQAAEAIDWSRPDSLKTYQSLQKQFVPTITRHKSALGKFQAYNGAVMQSQDYTDKMTMATTMAGLRRDLINAGYGAEAMAAGKAVERGELSMDQAITDLSDLLRQSKEKEVQAKLDRDIQLRRAPVDARWDAEMGGAYGGASSREPNKVDEITKMEAKAMLDRISEADKALRALPPTETAKREGALRELQAAKMDYRRLKQQIEAGKGDVPKHYSGNAQPEPRTIAAPEAPAGGDDKVVVQKDGKKFKLPRRQLEQAQQQGYELVP